MAGNKRKLENGNGTGSGATLSAFAARKKLLSQSANLASTPTTSGLAEQPQAITRETETSIHTERIGRKHESADLSSLGPQEVLGANPAVLAADNASTAQKDEAWLAASVAGGLRARATQQHSTFKATKQNYYSMPGGRISLKLSQGERIVVLGNYGIKVNKGTLTIYGSILSASDKTTWVHAPHSHALPVIRATENSVLELHPATYAQNLRQLERYNPVFGKLWNDCSTRTSMQGRQRNPQETFQIIFTSEDGPKRALLRDLVSPAEWNKRLAEATALNQSAPPIIFVCGPKSSGKSTFGKILTNRLVSSQGSRKKPAWPSVAVLDIDPGQPEYSPPGLISLNEVRHPNLSPSFCYHPSPESGCRQLKAHAIASVTPGQDPQHYINCVRDLIWHYRNNARVPLVVNTPGWIQGTGLDILVELIKVTQPTEVIYMSQEGPEETLEALKLACPEGTKLATLPSQAGENTARTALHLRTMQTMAYFHLDSTSTRGQRWHPSPLTAICPWKVRYQGKNVGMVGILCYDTQVPPCLLAEAVNGMVLAIVKVEDKAAFGSLLHSTRNKRKGVGSEKGAQEHATGGFPIDELADCIAIRTPEGIPMIPNPEGATLDPKHSTAVGLALVRGIDVDRKELQLITPVQDDVLLISSSQSFVLVAGKFDTPTWAYTEDLYNQDFERGRWESEARHSGETMDPSPDGDLSEDEEESGHANSRVVSEAPWVEKLHNDQKRTIGSRVWRVRRDLGRNQAST